jgi:hypothetical protein
MSQAAELGPWALTSLHGDAWAGKGRYFRTADNRRPKPETANLKVDILRAEGLWHSLIESSSHHPVLKLLKQCSLLQRKTKPK